MNRGGILLPQRTRAKNNEKAPIRHRGLPVFQIWRSWRPCIRATRGGCPYRSARRGSLACVEASGTCIPSSLPGESIFPAPAMAAPYPENICLDCGATTRRGRHCPKCGREISREKLIELAKLGRAAARSSESRKRHSETQRRHEAAKRAWRSSPKPDWPDEDTYVRQIEPRLAAVTISALASTLGVSESYAADIRAGRCRPHPRHWQALAELLETRSPFIECTAHATAPSPPSPAKHILPHMTGSSARQSHRHSW